MIARLKYQASLIALFAWLMLSAIFAAGFHADAFGGNQTQPYPDSYHAKVIEIIDGDTLIVEIQSWPQHYIKTRIRLKNIDTPEIRGKCDFEKQKAQQAKAFLEKLIPAGTIILLDEVELGTYAGRFIANAYKNDKDNKHDIGQMLLEAKLARPYHIKIGRQKWC